MDHSPNLTSDLPEPTEEELKQTKNLIKDKYDTTLPDTELARLVMLIKELEWWQKADTKPDPEHRFTGEQLSDLKELLEESGSQNLSQSSITNQAKSVVGFISFKERQRIAEEIRGIIVEHRPVPYEPGLAEKTQKLVGLYYDYTLSNREVDQLVPFMARTLWFTEGLDSSLEQCIDDLIKDSESYDKIRKALDIAILKLMAKERDNKNND